ncbi:hypothetical protein AB4394_17910 [Vibrio lentus]
MHPLRNGSQVTERPADKPVSGSPGYFTESGENNVPSYPGADWFNHVIDEFLNLLASFNITFDPSDDENLARCLDYVFKRTDGSLVFTSASVNDLSAGETISGSVEQKKGQIWTVNDTFFEIVTGNDGDVSLNIDGLSANYISTPFLNDNVSQSYLVGLISSKVGSKLIQAPSAVNISTEQILVESLNPTFPVSFDGFGSSLISVSPLVTHAAFDVGVDQVTSDLFRRDYHKYKGLFFTGGENADVGITFRPYTGNQCLIDDVTFMGFGNKDSWCLNFQAQNWWPIIDKFSLSDQGEHINGIKAIDDDTRVIAQGSGNSRVIIDKPRIRYLNGRETDTTGIKMAATSAIVHLSAIENASKGLQFHYPSNAAKLQNAYFEQAGSPSGSKSIVIGDDNIVSNNFFFNLYIKDVYSNLHSGNGKLIVMGNTSANFRDLVLDGLNVTLTSGQPLIEPNDIPAQSTYVGYVSSGDKTAVLPKDPKANPVHVVDTYNREWKVLNGNGQSAKLSGDSKVLPQNAGSILADFWSYIGDISATYFKRAVTGTERTLLRGATTAVRIASPGTGTYSTITYTIPDISEHAGIDNVIQLFARAEGGTTKTFRVSVKLSTGVTHVLSTTTDDVPQDWSEITVPFFFTNYNDLDDDAIITLEVFGGSLTTQLELTGVRVYEGNTGLCTSNAKSPTEQSMSANPWFYKTKITIPSGAVNFIVGFDTPVRNLGTTTETILLIIDGGATVTGNLAPDGLSASFNVTTGNSAVRTATVSLYHGGS